VRGDRIRVAIPLPPEDDDIRSHREAARQEQRLHHRLVHAHRRSEDAGADVRDVGEFEQPLHRPILAVRTVKDRKDDVDVHVGERGGGFDWLQRQAFRALRLGVNIGGGNRLRRCGRKRPTAVLADVNRHGFVLVAIDVLEDGGRRRDRHFVLARLAAVNDADANLRHCLRPLQ
jgi:hypothetical protein